MTIKTRTLSVLLFFISLSVFAETQLESFDSICNKLSEEDRTTLINEGEITRFHFDSFVPILLPEVPQKKSISSTVKEGNLSLGIEGLFLYKDFDTTAYKQNPAKVLKKMYNTVRAIGTLQGIEYYSASSKKMKTLFSESWIIPDLSDSKTKVNDAKLAKIPPFERLFVHQKDGSFGNNEYTMDFSYKEPIISAVLINKTNMYYKGFIKAIGPDKMQVHLVIIPTDKGLLFYGISAADTINFKAFREKANNSFYNRVVALYNWYISNLEA